MDILWYYAAIALAKILRALPLTAVARLGRIGGGITYFLDARHRRVAMLNLAQCLPEKTPAERRELLREHFRRLGENYASAVKTSGMSNEQVRAHLEVTGAEKLLAHGERGAVVAIGHFGNFELHARAGIALPNVRIATTYRALKQPRLDSLVKTLRRESGCLFFDRRRDGEALRRALASGGIFLGLLGDQHAGSGGLRVPFFGHSCSTTAAPAVLAQRYALPLHTAVCFRVAMAQWRIEIGDEIQTRIGGQRRNAAEIMADVNSAFEMAVRRDPANWFWVHDRWRFDKQRRGRTVNALAPA